MANFNQRSITDFRSRMTGGGARSNLFEVEITFPDELTIVGSTVSDKVPFLVKAAEILKDYNINFTFIGEGVCKQKIISLAGSLVTKINFQRIGRYTT